MRAHDIPRLLPDCARTYFYDLLPNDEIALLMIPCLNALSEVWDPEQNQIVFTEATGQRHNNIGLVRAPRSCSSSSFTCTAAAASFSRFAMASASLKPSSQGPEPTPVGTRTVKDLLRSLQIYMSRGCWICRISSPVNFGRRRKTTTLFLTGSWCMGFSATTNHHTVDFL